MNSLDSDAVQEIVQALSDRSCAESPLIFPSDQVRASGPGLYSWWADTKARAVLGDELEIPMPALIYAGQAGATRWPSGTLSTATLASRIGSNHIRGNASSSTFRLTLSALLLDPLDLKVARPGRLTTMANIAVSEWITAHLQVAVTAYHDRDTLDRIEDAVLEMLDPPLNLGGRPSTVWRARLTVLRRRITRPT